MTIKSGQVIPSEREVTQFRTYSSNVSSSVKSIAAPIQDLIQPTKKENATGNLRQIVMFLPVKKNKQFMIQMMQLKLY